MLNLRTFVEKFHYSFWDISCASLGAHRHSPLGCFQFLEELPTPLSGANDDALYSSWLVLKNVQQSSFLTSLNAWYEQTTCFNRCFPYLQLGLIYSCVPGIGLIFTAAGALFRNRKNCVRLLFGSAANLIERIPSSMSLSRVTETISYHVRDF